MAIMVYVTANGAAQSYISDQVSIARAQSTGQLADDATLTDNGFWRTVITQLSPTNVWDPTTLTTKTVAAPIPVADLRSPQFIGRFTRPEWRVINGSTGTDDYANQFISALNSSNVTNLNDPTVQDFVGTYAVSKGWLTQARANAILDTTGLIGN
jgi:hypothetical protein